MNQEEKIERIKEFRLIDDGLHEIFVNASVDDVSNIAELMQCFTQKDLNNPKFMAVTRRFKEIKETEGGLASMCKLMEDIVNEEKKQENINRIKKMINRGYSKEEILYLDYTEDEYEEAEKEFLTRF